MLLSSPQSPVLPESPLDVLSRAASMVESGSSEESDTGASPAHTQGNRTTNSFKDLHPKYRRHGATEYLTLADTVRTQKLGRQSTLHNTKSEAISPPVSPPTYPGPPVPLESEVPLDFSIRKRSSSPNLPPPYKYSNPLRQQEPPSLPSRSSQSPPPHTSSHTSHLPITPAPSYYRPPPYPRTPSPPHALPCRPPPPSYEAAIAAKPISPRLLPSIPTTSPTFITLHPRPFPCRAADSSPPAKDRPSVITTARRDVSQEDKENKGHKREMTIVEETGACDLMEEHFRKSLGADYSKLFKEKKESSEPPKLEPTHKMEVDPVKAFKEDLDMSGYTVEDHFAKALGETWTKLQAEAEKKEKTGSSSSAIPKLLAL